VRVDGELPGGVANAGQVFRQSDSVLRPSNPHSASIHSFLRALRGTGFEGASLPVEIQTDRQERVSDTYGLDAKTRDDLIDCLDRSMNRGEDFVRRRVAAGDPNFIRMLEAMGGIERYERRKGWWENKREEFVTAQT